MIVLSSLAALALTAGSGAQPIRPAAQGAQPATDDQPAEEVAQKIKRLTAWPQAARAAELRKEIRRLRAARVPEMAASARAALLEAGAATVPYLLPLLEKENDQEVLAHMREILDTVTGPPHTRLMAEYFSHRAIAVRLWALERCSRLPDPGLRPAVKEALEKLAKRGKKADEQERLAAALCLASTGSEEALKELLTGLDKYWKRWGETALIALEALRGSGSTELLADLLVEEERSRRLLGLRLLGACLDLKRADIVLPFLEGSDSGLRIAAINLLRQAFDGDPPLERLPVFEAIERANKWRAQLK